MVLSHCQLEVTKDFGCYVEVDYWNLYGSNIGFWTAWLVENTWYMGELVCKNYTPVTAD